MRVKNENFCIVDRLFDLGNERITVFQLENDLIVQKGVVMSLAGNRFSCVGVYASTKFVFISWVGNSNKRDGEIYQHQDNTYIHYQNEIFLVKL